MIYYENQEIKIRDILNEDVVKMFSWWTSKDVYKYDPRPIPNDSEQLLRECISFCNRFKTQIMSKKKKYHYFMITDKDDMLLGFVNFFNVNMEKKEGEMGIVIGDKTYWNKGIGFEASKVVIDYIFSDMEIERIYIETSEHNIPALRLCDKLNFTKCGEYIEDGDFKAIVMELRI